jgi:hypothetical protein
LRLFGLTTSATRPVDAEAPQAVLTSWIRPGERWHHFRFRVTNWRQQTLPVRLPADARLTALRVDGRWVDRPVSGTDSPLTSADDTGVRTVDLPVPSAASPGLHEFELVYIQPSATWCLWDWLESAAPVLPVEPTVFRHRWRLPAGVVPLGADSRPTGSVAKLFDPLPALPTWQTDGDGVRGQQLAMETAAQRALTAKPTTLGELIERLALALPADQGPLIVDAAALQEAGLDRATPIPSSAEPLKPWKAVGLVHVPCLGAPLLTTERQAASPDGAMQLAARAGHDPAGRFRQALDWLRGDPDGEPLASPAGLVAEALEPDWGEWPEPVGAASGFMVVRQTPVTAAGVLLACGALLLAWLTRQASSGRRLAWLAAWLTMAALGVLWLPYALRPVAAWPLGAGLLATVVLHLRLLLTKGARAAQPVSQAAAAALGFVALGISGLTGAPPVVPPAPATTVFLVPAVGGASDRETVLVPPALLTRLDALARTATDAPRGITVTAATYEGKAVDGAVEVDGLLQTFSFEDGPAVLALPLGGISLQGEVLVDGARAYPTALTAPQTGYQLKVEGRGPHVVRLHFRVPVQAAGAERDLQFTAPRPAQCRLTLRLPEGATHVSVLTRLGAQQVEGSTQGPLLQVDLGRAAAPIHARWRHDPPGSTPVVQTREAFFWQIRPGTSSLAALFEYTVTAGAVADLELDLPETLDVRNVEVRTASGQSPRLRDWQASGSGLDRRLRLEFQTPLSAPVVVRLDLVPRRALDATAELPFPTPRGAHAIRSAIAFRREGVEAQVNDLAHLTAIPPTDFTRFWKALGGDDPGTLAGAYAFTRRADAVPRLQLRLHAPLTIAEAAQDVVWHVDRHRTEFQATVRLTPEGGELVLAEWDVPPAVVVSRVTGRAVRQWSRSGPHLQVWLQGAEAPADIDLFGWVEGEEGSRGKPEPEARPFTFDVPAVVVRAARSQMTTVRVAAEPGLVLEPVQVQNLLALPDPRLSDGERCYVSHQAGYGGRFRLRAAGLPVVTRQLAFAELRGGRLVVTMIADCQVTRGEPKVLHVRLPDWRGDAQLDAVGALAVRRQESGWEIEFASGFSGTCRLTVTATVAREGAAGGVALPHLQVEGASKVEQWVAIDARELGAEGPRALDPVGAAADWPATWPGAADRVRRAGGQAWKAPSADWTLRVVPRPAAAPTASGQVAFTEQEAAVLDGHRWLHQATCWLYHEANTDLGVILPAGSAAVAATLDGEPVPAFQPGSDRLWLPLTGTNGVRVLRLRWQFDAGREALNHPLLERPRFDGLTEGPTLWSLHVPPGWSVSPEPVALSRAHQDLVRADARLRLSALLAGPVRAGDPPGLTLDALQQQFYRLCRLAQLDRSGVDGESTSDVAARLQNLRSRNADLARRLGFDAERAEAERQAGDHLTGRGTELPSLTDQGAMVAWTGEAGESVPQPRVTADASQGRTVAWLATAGILAALVLVWFVARLPDVEKWVRASWPEQVMLVGFLAWLTPLPPTLPAVLVLVGGAARFFAAGAWLRAGWERRAAVPLSAERPPAPG